MNMFEALGLFLTFVVAFPVLIIGIAAAVVVVVEESSAEEERRQGRDRDDD